ncbi:hypothetical protein Btru_000478 [Bulinus truncatus]|nr:hypothetical protein Btru_000478 [Bulinus truncatus]
MLKRTLELEMFSRLAISFVFSHVLLWQTSVDAKLICPAIIKGQNYAVTAEWYSTSTSNDLVSAKLYLQGYLGAICSVQNMTCQLQGLLVSLANSLTIQPLDHDYQISASTTADPSLLGRNLTIVWALLYGQYVESCSLKVENAIDECQGSTNVCLNNGTCTDQPVGYSCKCATGFSGYSCDHSDASPCTVSTSMLIMWENLTSSDLSLTCENLNISSDIVLVQFPNATFRMAVDEINETEALLFFDLLVYNPGIYNFIIVIDTNYHQLVTISVYNPPRFLSPPSTLIILENMTSWTVNVTAVTDNVPSALTYFVKEFISGYNLKIDKTGLITATSPTPNNMIGSFNITVEVLDTVTNLSTTWTVHVIVQDVNESPVCTVLSSVASVYLSTSSTTLARINCTDPDRTEEFTQLNYAVISVPPSVNVSIDKSGNVVLIDTISVNVTSFNVSVSARDVGYVAYSNFSVRVINDVPSCSMARNVLLLWESKPTGKINVTCETVDPENVHSINYTGFDISFQELFNISMISENNKTALFNVSIMKFSLLAANHNGHSYSPINLECFKG